jgi:membrane fusion protein (multidrug efflux system)
MKIELLGQRFQLKGFGTSLLAAAIFLDAGCGKKEATKPPPPEVYVTQAVQKDVPVTMELVGQTAGSKDVEIRARVEGYLESVNFLEGDFVKQGDLLYTIDPKSFEASLAQAKGNLANAKAKLDGAEITWNRLKPLAVQQAVSQQDFDTATSNRDSAKASVDAAKAAVDQAQLNLGYTHITAPLSGLADLTKVKPGNLVGRNESTLLTTISVVDPIYFNASITEADYLRLAEKAVKGPRQEEQKATVDLVLADGGVYPFKGRLDAIQRAIDPKTGTLATRLVYPNPERVLRPGQYGRIRFTIETLKGAICVPQKAVQELQGVRQVIVVGADRKAEIRTVKMGPRDGDHWVVTDGLKAGETVVVEGLQSVKPGAEVAPKPVEATPAVPTAPAVPAEPGKPAKSKGK